MMQLEKNSAVGEKEDHFKAEARPFLDHQETPGGKGGRKERHEGRRGQVSMWTILSKCQDVSESEKLRSNAERL